MPHDRYMVRSGGVGAMASASFSFRALPDATTPTRLAIYGDLGVLVKIKRWK